MIKHCGREYGVYSLRTKLKTCFGELVEMPSPPRKTQSVVWFWKILSVISVMVLWRIHYMLFHHAPWSCSKLDIMWTDLVLWNYRCTCMFVDFKELLSQVIQQDRNPELFAMTTWLIRTQQNQVYLAQSNVNLHLLEQVLKD